MLSMRDTDSGEGQDPERPMESGARADSGDSASSADSPNETDVPPAAGSESDSAPWPMELPEELSQEIYDELRRLAKWALHGERQDHTLQPTALANEAWLRLADQHQSFENDSHFKAIASRMIRRVLVDSARKKHSEKRGGGVERVTLCEPIHAGSESREVDLIGLDVALDKLKCVGERPHSVVELRFFGGLTEEETAKVLGLSKRTVARHWAFAKAWLYRELESH